MKRTTSLGLLVILLVGLFASVRAQDACLHEVTARCFDVTCATPVDDIHAFTPCECGDDDIGSFFTECDPRTNTMSMVYFYKPPAICLNGTLPLPVHNIPCTATCASGTFLNTNTELFTCDTCKKGSVSAGTGQIWTLWNEMPSQFSTRCAIGNSNQACQSWQLRGSLIDSGDNYRSHYLESVLELRLNLIRPGNITFNYTVSAENGYDGLWFTVDNLGIWFKSNQVWTSFTQQLSKGYHTLTWVYSKDRTLSYGEDRAKIALVQVDGTTLATPKCDICPPGTFSDREGASQCQPCPAGTYNPGFDGAPNGCQTCPVGQSSFAGATSCFANRVCDMNDVTFSSSPCVNGVSTKTFSFIQPQSCNSTGVNLPSNVNVSCNVEACSSGTFRDSSDPTGNTCTICPSGTASAGTTSSGFTTCQTCQKGQFAANKTVHYHSWNVLPDTFDTSCLGTNCFGKGGWRSASQYIDSGLGQPELTSSDITTTINAYDHATVNFRYSLFCPTGNFLVFSVNSQVLGSFPCGGCGDLSNFVESPIFSLSTGEDDIRPPFGNFQLTWSYSKQVPGNGSCDRVLIEHMKFAGIRQGSAGAVQCSGCASGSYSDNIKQEECSPCQIGYASAAGSSSCQECQNNTFADRQGTPQCFSCGLATVANSDRSACEFDCSEIPVGDLEYNFRDIQFWNIDLSQSPNLTTTISGNLCNYNPFCVDQTGNALHTYLCSGTVSSQEKAKTVSFLALPEKAVGAQVVYENEFLNCKTIIKMLCDPDAGSGVPSIDKGAYPAIVQSTDAYLTYYQETCQMYLQWTTVFACPQCTEADYGFYDGDCSNNQATRTYFQVNDYCNGGFNLPATTLVSCTPQLIISHAAIAAIVVAVFIVVLGAASVGIYFWWKHKKLYSQYSQLRNTHLPMDADIQEDVTLEQ